MEHRIFHIYNRGVDKRDVFMEEHDLSRFLWSLMEFNTTLNCYEREIRTLNVRDQKLVHIHAYCLLNNHFHILVEEVAENGVSSFMHKLGTGYTKYFNKKYNRSGSLFQGRYKFRLIEYENDYLQILAYVIGNSVVHNYVDQVEKYPWSSIHEYILKKSYICYHDVVRSYFEENKSLLNHVNCIASLIKESRSDVERPEITL